MKKKTIRNIQINFHPDQPFIELAFDTGTKRILARTSEKARDFYRDDENRKAADAVDGNIIIEWGTGLDALDKLAYIPSQQIHLSRYEIHAALKLVCTASLTLSLVKKSIRPLPEAILILGEMTLCRLPARKLPAAEEIWKEVSVEESIWISYERLRLEALRKEPHLFVLSAYLLRHELSKVNPSDLQVQLLIKDLEEVSRGFAYTLKRLAMTEAEKLGGQGRP